MDREHFIVEAAINAVVIGGGGRFSGFCWCWGLKGGGR